MAKPVGRFDADSHAYWLAGRAGERRVPSVTQVLAGTIGVSWRASEFYLRKGQAVHLACAYVARGLQFEHDPRITGQIEACRRFLREFAPKIIEIEQVHFSALHHYAGTPDIVIETRHRVVVDYKATLTSTVGLQLGGYGELIGCDWGMGVQLNADGSYKTTGEINLKRLRREFLTLLGAYNIMSRYKAIKEETDEHNDTTSDTGTGDYRDDSQA